MDQNLLKRPRELNSKNPETIPRELNSVWENQSNIAPEGVKKENKPFRVKNQFLDGNWKCQKKTKFFKWSRPKKLNSVRLLTRKYQDEFYFRWLENSIIDMGKPPTNSLIFHHLYWKPFSENLSFSVFRQE